MKNYTELTAEQAQTLLPVTVNQNGEKAVYGRDLHQALEIETDYPRWFKRQLDKGLFEENSDYAVTDKFVPNPSGGKQKLIDHLLTLDMAKEVAMLAKTEMGKQVRRYFIEVEKKSRFQQVPTDPMSILRNQFKALEMVGAQVNTLKLDQFRLESQIKEIQNTTPLYPAESEELQKLINQKAVNALGGKASPAYQDPGLRQKAFSAIYREIWNQFEVKSYKAILHKEFSVAKNLIKNLPLPYRLEQDIRKVNAHV